MDSDNLQLRKQVSPSHLIDAFLIIVLILMTCLCIIWWRDSTVIKVVLGAHDLSAKTEDNRQVFNVLDVFSYDDNMGNQITLLRLSSAVTYTSKLPYYNNDRKWVKRQNNIFHFYIVLYAYIIEYIRPVCLPSWDDPDFANETVVVTGWTPSGIITLTLMPINHPLNSLHYEFMIDLSLYQTSQFFSRRRHKSSRSALVKTKITIPSAPDHSIIM
jgi:hypothetical protein